MARRRRCERSSGPPWRRSIAQNMTGTSRSLAPNWTRRRSQQCGPRGGRCRWSRRSLRRCTQRPRFQPPAISHPPPHSTPVARAETTHPALVPRTAQPTAASPQHPADHTTKVTAAPRDRRSGGWRPRPHMYCAIWTLSCALAVWNENVSALPMYPLTSREYSLYLNDIVEGIEHEPSAKFWRADMVVYLPDNAKDAATLVGTLRPTWSSDSCPV